MLANVAAREEMQMDITSEVRKEFIADVKSLGETLERLQKNRRIVFCTQLPTSPEILSHMLDLREKDEPLTMLMAADLDNSQILENEGDELGKSLLFTIALKGVDGYYGEEERANVEELFKK